VHRRRQVGWFGFFLWIVILVFLYTCGSSPTTGTIEKSTSPTPATRTSP
jgi:hypothetical protein